MVEKAILPAYEYENIIHFASEIARPTKNIRLTIQHQLDRFFGYSSSIFWLSDDEGNLTNPSPYYVSDHFLAKYLDEFHQFDILLPRRNLNLFLEKKILRISDILPFSEYEKSFYYQNCMKPYQFYDELGIILTYENKIIGAIGMAKHYSDGHFSQLDCMRFYYLSKIISSVLIHELKNDWNDSLLSKREREVVQLVKEGKTNEAIAKDLHISINTVKKHLQNIFQKYSVNNRTQLIEKIRNLS